MIVYIAHEEKCPKKKEGKKKQALLRKEEKQSFNHIVL